MEDIDKKLNIEIDNLLTSQNKTTGCDLNFMFFILARQARILGLANDLFTIHSTFGINELMKFTIEDLKAYCDIFGINIDKINSKIIIATIISQEKIRFLELERYHSYIEKILFSNREQRYFNIDLNLSYYEIPSVEQIINDGFERLYFRIGDLSIESMCRIYEKFELILILTHLLLSSKKFFVLCTNQSKEDICAMILSIIDSMKYDIRGVLTTNRIWSIHKLEEDEIDIVLNDFLKPNIISIKESLSQQGYSIHKGMTDEEIYLELCMHVLYYPNFTTDVESNRLPIEACNQSYTVSGTPLLIGDSNLIYYGNRTGNEKYYAYTINELYQTFKKYKYFYDPYTIENEEPKTFIPSSILRLKNFILPKKFGTIAENNAKNLIKLINEIWNDFPNDKFLENYIKKVIEIKPIKELTTLINTSIELTQWDQFIEPNWIDIENKPTKNFLTVLRWTNQIRNKVRMVLWLMSRDLKKTLCLNKLPLIKKIDGKFVICHRNDYNTIDTYLRGIQIMADYNLLNVIPIASKNLYCSSLYYNMNLLGGTFKVEL